MNKTVYFLIDCSGSMKDARADAVNTAMEKVVDEVLPEIRAQRSADTNISFQVLGFSDAHKDKVFVIVPRTDLEDFTSWDNIQNDVFSGGTPTGAAIKAVMEDIEGGLNGDIDVQAAAPAIILISDGLPNGVDPTYEEALQYAVKNGPYGEHTAYRRALKVAIGMNADAAGRESLMKFGHLSAKMEGISAYYDCTDEYVDQFVEILKSVTLNLSVDKKD